MFVCNGDKFNFIVITMEKNDNLLIKKFEIGVVLELCKQGYITQKQKDIAIKQINIIRKDVPK